MEKAIVVSVFIAIWCALVAAVWWLFYFLWHAIAVDVFGLPELTFWQSVGLLALIFILTGGIRGSASGK